MYKILVTIICLLKGQKSQTLSLLQTNSMYIDDSHVIFHISKLTKTSRPNFNQKPLEFLAYLSEKVISVVRIVKLYLEKTANLRDKTGILSSLVMLHHMRWSQQKLLLVE